MTNLDSKLSLHITPNPSRVTVAVWLREGPKDKMMEIVTKAARRAQCNIVQGVRRTAAAVIVTLNFQGRVLASL